MRVRVKICGVTRVDAVLAAAEAGADLVGFVFADSPRQLTPRRAAELAAAVPAEMTKVAVFRQLDRGLLAEACAAIAPGLVQADAASLEDVALPPGVRPLPVWRDGQVPDAGGGLLLYEGRRSGEGARADWKAAARLARRSRLILAGGLDAGNVVEAIRRVRPYAVDVSSGVESRRGVKSPGKVIAFVAAVRAATRAGSAA